MCRRPRGIVNHIDWSLGLVAPTSTNSKLVPRIDKTFRVRGIPLDFSIEQMEQLIQDLLGYSKDETGLQCRSLATHHSGTSQDATISFSKSCPPYLQSEIPYSTNSEAVNDSPTLTFDDGFLGLTTLNSCRKSKHKVK